MKVHVQQAPRASHTIRVPLCPIFAWV
jgi:hypothetical protein